MLIIPAIDIQDGCVVRLVQGRLERRVYSKDPLKTAKHWVRQGAKLIHVVDLDGAYSGKVKNFNIVKDIAKNLDVPVEFGGGVRDIQTIKSLLNSGVFRVVLGTKVIEDKSFLREAFNTFKTKIIVSIDAKEDKILIKGWQTASLGNIRVLDFVRLLEKIGFKKFIYTDTLKDGTLSGPNIKGIKTLLKKTGLGMIASGGISSLDDINKLKLLEKSGLEGIIIGKALYEGRFTLTRALNVS